MYEDIFTHIRNEAEKRNLKENTINAYYNFVDYFLRTINKDVSADALCSTRKNRN